jgi:hypothetical protein
LANKPLVGERNLRATVGATYRGTETPSGPITCIIDGTKNIDSDIIYGNATFDISSLSKGSHSVIAWYKGNNNFRPSTSSSLQLTVPDNASNPPDHSNYTLIVAVIGFIGTIIAAMIGLYGKRK